MFQTPKPFRMTKLAVAGFRIGWMALSGNKKSAADYIEGLNMLSNMRLCSNVPAQSIVQTALGGWQSCQRFIQPGGRIYEQKEFIYKALCDIPGVSCVKPKAAFYIFPKLDPKVFNIRTMSLTRKNTAPAANSPVNADGEVIRFPMATQLSSTIAPM